MAYIIVEERGIRRHVPFGTSGRLRVGRGPDNDIVLMDEKSSRNHAVIEQTRTGFMVRDLDSLNGCHVGGLRIREHVLGFGDGFSIGRARLTLETEQSTAIDSIAADTRAGSEMPVGSSDETGIREPVRQPSSGSSQQRSTRPSSVPLLVPLKHDAPQPAVRGQAEEPDAILIRALGAFRKQDILGDANKLMDVLCEFVGRLIPNTRVCLAVPEKSELVPKHFFNFITSSPRDELPREFAVAVTKTAAGTKVMVQSSQDAPSRAYLPVRSSAGVAVMLIERESVRAEFSARERTLMVALMALLSAMAGFRGVLEETSGLRASASRLEGELANLREELQRRLDLQTAELTRQREELSRLVMAPQFRYDYSGIVGRSRPMVELFHLLDKVTDLPIPVLIIGESGTGKELIARALHFNSARATKGAFVAENCAALPETLLESELFGHARGAFTGADRDKVGIFEHAQGGTIFLDEIGETTPALQAKLLRVLEEGEIRPVGSNRVKKVDFRLVAATNRPLDEWVKAGKFRQDLYYRINVITVRLPPLRERRDDIPMLVQHFLSDAAGPKGSDKIRATGGVMRALMEYAWPGNVRELENEVKRMVALSDGKKLSVELLSPAIRGGVPDDLESTDDLPLKDLVERIESRRIQEVMKETGGNKSKAAERLGLSRLGLRKKMERYGLGSGDEE